MTTANVAHKVSIGEVSSSNQEFDDGRSYDPVIVHQITQDWIDRHMKEREDEFTETVSARVFCGTWNVNGKVIKDEGLEDWLVPAESPYSINGIPTADIYVVGFQEMVDLTVVNVAVDTKSQQRSQFWQERIAECLASRGGKYTQVQSKYLVGLLICVFVKDTAMPYVKDVRSTSVGVGVMGVMGNKGGVCVRLCLYDSSICFVCTHLAAHTENVAGRNSDYKNIYEKAVFTPVVTSEGAANLLETQNFESKHQLHYRTGLSLLEEFGIKEHDLVFWIGDLNYRIDEAIPMEDVFLKVNQNDFKHLLEHDQLNVERAEKRVFHGFSEGTINFPPTYKYQPGTSEYDRRPEKKVRTPAWCDRILWKSLSNSLDSVKQLTYERADLKPSDHKPVMSMFNCSIRKIVSDKEKLVFHDLIRILDELENNCIPKVKEEGTAIDFGLTHFNEAKESIVKLKNEGKSIAHWRFVPKLDEKFPCKRWISLNPDYGMLLPNEEADISISIIIDTVTADALNSGKDVLEDIIVLRIENGRDIFITVKATYARSCFGMSLEQLVCTMQPIRSLPIPGDESMLIPESSGQGGSPRESSMVHMSIPKELWRLVDALWQGGGMKERELFSSNAETGEVERIRECLDTGDDLPPCSAHSIAECIVCLIASLPQPLIPVELYPTQVSKLLLLSLLQNYAE